MRRIAILGAAESGVGAAVLAKKVGYEVFVSDAGAIGAERKAVLEAHGIEWEEGGHSVERIVECSLAVKSPGIPDTAPVIQRLIEAKVSILSELEFAKPYSKGKTICITGSNGKTTTTKLIYHIMQRAGLDVGLGGNIGRSYAMQVAESDHDWYVLEVSSFQLDNMYDFRADIAVLMNITPDHLDRYEFEMQNYANSKMRITQNQRPTDHFVYWDGDPLVAQAMSPDAPDIWRRATTPSSREKANSCPQVHKFADDDFEALGLAFSQMGQHNKRNALAAYLATGLAGVDEALRRRCLVDFPGVPHRLETVAEKGGVKWINDSKATNVDACRVALEAMDRPTVLILGGLDKGNDYSTIAPLIAQRCVGLVYLGADNSKLHQSLDQLGLPVRDTHTMADCVLACAALSAEGQNVLLSPCCASFDLFNGMADRGNQFKEEARRL